MIKRDKIIDLSESQQSAIDLYHKNLITRLSSIFDIDSNKHEKQLSLGMKIASFLGALGITASVFFFFYQFWGKISTNTQIIILITTPLLALSLTIYAYTRETTGYFVKICSLVSLACFILNIFMLGQIFNITPSPNALLVWAVFAFLLAYASDTRLLLASGIICFACFLSAKTGTWHGCYWIDFGNRPENFLPASIIIFLISFFPHEKFSGFTSIYRVFAMLLFFIPILILSNSGSISYLNLSNESIEVIYQIAGFVFSAGAIWLGIKKTWNEVVNTGNVFFTIFLYTKFFDWWWDFMPKYLFFLILGLTAILILLIFKRLRKSINKNTMSEVY
jgi:uncharacterized membrane protein